MSATYFQMIPHCIFTEKDTFIHYWQMLKLLNLSEESMYYIFHFVGFQKSFSKSKAEIKLAQTEGIRDDYITVSI